MKIKKKRTEKGQSLILVTLMLIAFLAMLALLLDGGMTYWHRRNAQNAADAGALAGAEVLCKTKDTTQAYNTALEYAIARNGATTANASVTWLDPGGTVEVWTNINFRSFFARLFRMNSIDAPGHAKAGCAPPAGVGVMPVAWSCKAPIGEENPTSCEVLYMDDPPFEDVPDGQCTWGDDPMYIIADSDTVSDDVVCNDPNGNPVEGGVDCDLDDDGVNDVEILGGGDRSWLDLNGGGGGAAELIDWVQGDYVNLAVSPHDWVSAQTGVTVSVYDAVYDYILQKDVVVPVFDLVHADGPPPPGWPHPQDEIIGNEPHDYFHIASFSYWRTTCVDSGSHGPCPAREALNDILALAGWSNGDIQSLSSMEGCFIKGSVGGIGGTPGQGVDAGVYTVFLME